MIKVIQVMTECAVMGTGLMFLVIITLVTGITLIHPRPSVLTRIPAPVTRTALQRPVHPAEAEAGMTETHLFPRAA